MCPDVYGVHLIQICSFEPGGGVVLCIMQEASTGYVLG